MATVTYLGPSTPADPSTQFIAIVPGDDGEASYVFPRGVIVYDVPEAALEQINAARGHRFEVGIEKASESRALSDDDADGELADISVTDRDAVAPWDGYDDDTVEEIEQRLREAVVAGNPGLVEQAKLYEAAHKKRKGVEDFDPAAVSAATDE